MSECPNCGARESKVLPVYEHEDNQEDDSEQPKYIACKSCHRLMVTRYLRSEDDETPPQAHLSQHDRDWLASRGMVGNQNNQKLSIVGWQCIKGAALYYGVRDWKAKADSTLTVDENVSLMEQYGTRNNRTTIRKMKPQVE